MGSTYLLVNFFCILIPLIFSFHPKLNFYKQWQAFLPALFATLFLFVLWDMYFVSIGIWSFNPRYLSDRYIINLPLEEILFFICIPYACVFTYYCLNKLYLNSINLNENFSPVFIAALLSFSWIFSDKAYSCFTFASLAVLLIIAKYFLKLNWLKKFYLVYALLLIPFLIVNGILTGYGLEEPIVNYNEEEIIGLRILTIPVEDIFYGCELILMNLIFYHYFRKKQNQDVQLQSNANT